MFFKQKYTKSITANYTGTTMNIKNGKFYINCEYIVDDDKYVFKSKPLYSDPQGFIKDLNIKTFEVFVKEKNNKILYDKYLVNISQIKELIEKSYDEE